MRTHIQLKTLLRKLSSMMAAPCLPCFSGKNFKITESAPE